MTFFSESETSTGGPLCHSVSEDLLQKLHFLLSVNLSKTVTEMLASDKKTESLEKLLAYMSKLGRAKPPLKTAHKSEIYSVNDMMMKAKLKTLESNDKDKDSIQVPSEPLEEREKTLITSQNIMEVQPITIGRKRGATLADVLAEQFEYPVTADYSSIYPANYTPKGVFKVPLEYVQCFENVPRVIEETIKVLEDKSLLTEGIMRISADSADIQYLKKFV